MKPRFKGVLHNRAALLVALAFCIYSAWPRSFPTLAQSNDRDPGFIVALLFCIFFIALPIAIRSPLIGDRIVFGAASVAFILRGITMVLSSPSMVRAVIFGCKTAVWVTATVGIVLVLGFQPRQPSSKS